MALSSGELIQSEPRKHAGGRPKGSTSAAKWYKARGINPVTAGEILARYDEHKLWERLIMSDDERVSYQSLVFLVSMRDGRPAQQINVTTQNVTFSTDDIERARAIVREIRGDMSQRVSEQPSMAAGAAGLIVQTIESKALTGTSDQNEALCPDGSKG